MGFVFRKNKQHTEELGAGYEEPEDQWRYDFDSVELQTEQVALKNSPSWPKENFQEELEGDYSEEYAKQLDIDSYVAEKSPRFVRPVQASGNVLLKNEVEEDVYPKRVISRDPGLTFEEDLRRRFGGTIRSALGPGTVVEGKFSFEEPVRIDGTLTGEVISTSALIVGEQAHVQANIRVGSLIVQGAVSGRIEATDLVEIRSSGRIEGDIRTERIAIEEGGFFKGRCN